VPSGSRASLGFAARRVTLSAARVPRPAYGLALEDSGALRCSPLWGSALANILFAFASGGHPWPPDPRAAALLGLPYTSGSHTVASAAGGAPRAQGWRSVARAALE
jgi:hypothetical protein